MTGRRILVAIAVAAALLAVAAILLLVVGGSESDVPGGVGPVGRP